MTLLTPMGKENVGMAGGAKIGGKYLILGYTAA
jgi:hypothetical protein